MEQPTRAIHDRQAEAKPAARPPPVMLWIVTPVELAEYLLALIIRNARPCIPDFDPQISAALASADQNTTAGDRTLSDTRLRRIWSKSTKSLRAHASVQLERLESPSQPPLRGLRRSSGPVRTAFPQETQ
jgi:hypothetical protein